MGVWTDFVEEDCGVDYVSVHGFRVCFVEVFEGMFVELLTGKISEAYSVGMFLDPQNCLQSREETSRRQVLRR